MINSWDVGGIYIYCWVMARLLFVFALLIIVAAYYWNLLYLTYWRIFTGFFIRAEVLQIPEFSRSSSSREQSKSWSKKLIVYLYIAKNKEMCSVTLFKFLTIAFADRWLAPRSVLFFAIITDYLLLFFIYLLFIT